MRKIEKDEYKKLLLELLKYVDGVCRKNNINYSLLGGSLIGAIRDGGIIPWDDDIDIVLLRKDYDKLLNILEKEKESKFKLITHKNNNTYFYPFSKVVNTETILQEKHMEKIKDYGVYLDIFAYDYVPDNKLKRRIHYALLIIYKKMFGLSVTSKTINNPLKKCIAYYAKLRKNKYWLKKYNEESTRYNNKKEHKYILYNWPAYGYEHEMHLASDFKEFIDWNFDGQKAMVTKNYDEILKTTFGDYMTPPPECKRIAHNSVAYWKDDNKKRKGRK